LEQEKKYYQKNPKETARLFTLRIKARYIRKICVFFLKAVFVLQIRNACRKYKGMRKITFGTIRLLVSKNEIGADYLLNLLNLQIPFAI